MSEADDLREEQDSLWNAVDERDQEIERLKGCIRALQATVEELQVVLRQTILEKR